MRHTGASEAAFERGLCDALNGIDSEEESDLTDQAIEIRTYYLMGRYVGDKLPLNGELMTLINKKCRENVERFDGDLFYHMASVNDEIWPDMKKAAGKPDRKNLGTAAGEYAIAEMQKSARLSCPYRGECAQELATEMASRAVGAALGSPGGVPSVPSPTRRSEPRAVLRGKIPR